MRWGGDFARGDAAVVEAHGRSEELEVVIFASAAQPARRRKRVRVNGVNRRATALARVLRTVLFAPEDMLLVSRLARRCAAGLLDDARRPARGDRGAVLATYARALTQRNTLLRRIREEAAGRDELGYWDGVVCESGGRILDWRREALAALAEPLAAAHREIAPGEPALALRYVTNVEPRAARAAARRCAAGSHETADKELWNGATLVGPHRDDLAFEAGGRDLRALRVTRPAAHRHPGAQARGAGPARRQLDGRPPLLLLDDVFSELDPERRAHLVRRIGSLPQAFVTTTTPDDLDPALVAAASLWQVAPGTARLVPADRRPPAPADDLAPGRVRQPAAAPPPQRIGDLLPGLASSWASTRSCRRRRPCPPGAASSRSTAPAAGASRPDGVRPPALVVSAADAAGAPGAAPAVRRPLLDAFAQRPRRAAAPGAPRGRAPAAHGAFGAAARRLAAHGQPPRDHARPGRRAGPPLDLRRTPSASRARRPAPRRAPRACSVVVVRLVGRLGRVSARRRPLVAETIRHEYYYDESAGVAVCLEKAVRNADRRLRGSREGTGLPPGTIGIAAAVVRNDELYLATVGAGEAYLVRGARLLMPDRSAPAGLPLDDGRPRGCLARRARRRRRAAARVPQRDRDGRHRGAQERRR